MNDINVVLKLVSRLQIGLCRKRGAKSTSYLKCSAFPIDGCIGNQPARMAIPSAGQEVCAQCEYYPCQVGVPF